MHSLLPQIPYTSGFVFPVKSPLLIPPTYIRVPALSLSVPAQKDFSPFSDAVSEYRQIRYYHHKTSLIVPQSVKNLLSRKNLSRISHQKAEKPVFRTCKIKLLSSQICTTSGKVDNEFSTFYFCFILSVFHCSLLLSNARIREQSSPSLNGFVM